MVHDDSPKPGIMSPAEDLSAPLLRGRYRRPATAGLAAHLTTMTVLWQLVNWSGVLPCRCSWQGFLVELFGNSQTLNNAC
jgi:hypothetical protein